MWKLHQGLCNEIKRTGKLENIPRYITIFKESSSTIECPLVNIYSFSKYAILTLRDLSHNPQLRTGRSLLSARNARSFLLVYLAQFLRSPSNLCAWFLSQIIPCRLHSPLQNWTACPLPISLRGSELRGRAELSIQLILVYRWNPEKSVFITALMNDQTRDWDTGQWAAFYKQQNKTSHVTVQQHNNETRSEQYIEQVTNYFWYYYPE